jgi:hypothetical protein
VVTELAKRLEKLPWSVEIATSDWDFAAPEIVHVLAITLVVGTIAIVDLRLLGVGHEHRRISELTQRLLPWTWTALGVAFLAGSLMFASKASGYSITPSSAQSSCA